MARVSRLDLLDSALHAPLASFGGEEFYPKFVDKAAVLTLLLATWTRLRSAPGSLLASTRPLAEPGLKVG